MKTLGAAAIIASVLTATSAGAEIVVTDADENGSFSFEEMLAAYPDLTEDQYAEIDTNGDGTVEEAELAAAVEAGIIDA